MTVKSDFKGIPSKANAGQQNWYALYTKPHAERQVDRTLRERGIESYLPAVHVKARPGRPSLRPFFPCYLFARVNLDAVGPWALQYMPGVRRLVMLGGVPAVVHPQVVAHIRARLANSPTVDERGEVMDPGDRVRITTGPFKELEGIFQAHLSEQGRVRVLIAMIERFNRADHWVKLELGSEDLRKIS